ncbi:cytochrome P450 [Pseudaestuariivita atlantica]|uniref:Cytochrome P450 n=1 Tax=Pseudaestuariivita atlantica TaxID=1317121 RepID=A0A0L1JP30_9RHOB|nr:cytochrome P450 [Pseudaestuariivita atlantica]KNG93178.1 cytochrome P450 [Pseudaestuariivita atlantica]
MRDLTDTGDTPVRVHLHDTPMGLLQSWQAARRNVIDLIPKQATEEPILSGRTGTRWHMVMDPGALRHVLLDRLEDYPKSTVTKALLQPAVGEGLFVAEGAHWRWQRRVAAPVFTHRNIAALTPIMTAAAERSAERIAQAGARAVDVAEDMVLTTFDVISEVCFSGDDSFDAAAVHRAIDDYIADAGKISLFDVLGAPDWIPRPGRVRTAGTLAQMKRAADTMIAARAQRGAGEVPDLLDLLQAGEDPKTGRHMRTEELRDNLLTFVVAGHETTALALSWALYLLAFDPEVQDRARAEAQSVLSGPATGADVPNLPLIRRIVDEALRLYPPAGVVSRTAQRADEILGADIRPGDTVMIPIYAIHRHRKLWSDPDAFDPDRFLDRSAIPRYAYLPFGDGPRICIGASFALSEAVIILATLISRFRFTAVKGRDPKPVMILTLRPEGGVWLMAEPV